LLSATFPLTCCICIIITTLLLLNNTVKIIRYYYYIMLTTTTTTTRPVHTLIHRGCVTTHHHHHLATHCHITVRIHHAHAVCKRMVHVIRVALFYTQIHSPSKCCSKNRGLTVENVFWGRLLELGVPN